ncbi:MAG: alpha-amylase family glycosyl hydrolase [Terracidiphilus sp.]|jgi:glycosidase
MKPARRLVVIAVFVLACGLWASGQESSACSPAQGASGPCSASGPRIDKIDPPGWWAGLPDPMLLVHGEGLNHARFTLSGTGVTLNRTQASENGHWAFLWLETRFAAPQTMWITASNDQGQSRRSYVLAERSHQADGHSGFSSADVLYLIMTDRFADGNAASDPAGDNRASARGWHGGDLAGIEQHLDYLKQLGVTAVWTTPVASNDAMPVAYHGYAATDLYAVDPHFGTLADYQHLSDALHARGMKLVIDLVPNHIGVKHPWVLDPPAPGWLHGTLEHHSAVKNDFYQLLDPHAPPQAWRNITDGWFTDDMPDLNQENPLVARYLIQNALWWVETANLDGIRLDTFPYVDRAFWHDYHATLNSVYPHLTTVGEIFNGDPEVTSYFAGGVAHQGIDTGLYTPFDFPVFFALRDVLAHDKPMTELATILRQDALYPHPERLVPFIGNHDTTRFLTEAGGSVPRLNLALGLLATLRGMPELYSGDEIGMEGGNDPDNRRDFPGGFPGDTHNAFTRAGRTTTEQQIFAWTSGMLALRASHPALKTGLEQDLFADNDVFAFVRAPEEGGCSSGHSSDPSQERLLIIVNKARRSESLELPVEGTALSECTEFQAMAPAMGTTPVVGGGKLHIEEPAESMTVYEVR